MKERELIFEEHISKDEQHSIIFVSATFEALCAEAEMQQFKKLLKPECVDVEGCDMVEFVDTQRSRFAGIEDQETFFYSGERKKLVYDMMCELEVSKSEVIGKIRYGDSLIPRALAMGCCEALFPIHERITSEVDFLSEIPTD